MGFAEIQFSETTFLSLLPTVASMASNPFPTFDFLPKDQLIHSLNFGGKAEFGPPSGLTKASGSLVVGLPVTINHVSIDQLAANPNDAGTDVAATLWADVSMLNNSVHVTILRVDVGKKHHALTAPTPLITQDVPVPLEDVTVHAAGLLRDADSKIVVVRFALSASSASSLLTTPVIDHSGGKQWAIFVDQNVLTKMTRDQFNAALAKQLAPRDNKPMPFKHGIVQEDAVRVIWDLMANGSWGMTITLGILAIDACPALIGDDVNMSVEVIGSVEVTPNVEDQVFDLKLHITHDVSDWDSFRCGLQNLMGAWLLSLTDPLVASLWAGLGSVLMAELLLILFPPLIDDMTHDTIGKQKIKDDRFTKLSKPDGDDDSTFTSTLPMAVFPGGTVESGVVDVFGLTVRGEGPLLSPGRHKMTITPPIISGGWDDRYSCSSFSWEKGEYLCIPVTITDTVTAFTAVIARPRPIVFGTTEARSRKKWRAEVNRILAEVTVVSKTTVEPGASGKLWVHSSAGLASVPIAEVPNHRPTPTGEELVDMKMGCQKTSGNSWKPGGFDVRWLIDPPPSEAVVDMLRQWVLQMPDLGRDSTIDVTTVGPGLAQRFQLKGGGTKNTIAVTTPSTQTLHVTVGGSAAVNVVVSQRLLVAVAATDLDAPVVALTRTPAGEIAAHTEKNVSILALDGSTLARRSATSLAADTPRVAAQVRTLALERERVIVALGSRILIAHPWGARHNVIL